MPKKKKKPAKPAPRRLRLAKKVFLKDIDYKNIEVIKQFLSPRFKILPRKVTGLNAKMQTQLKLSTATFALTAGFVLFQPNAANAQ